MNTDKNKFLLKDIIPHSLDEVANLISSNEQPSVFEDYDDYQILVLRHMTFLEKSLTFKPEVFIFSNSNVYFYLRDENQFIKLKKGIQTAEELLLKYYKNNRLILNSYLEEIENLENTVFERNIPRYFIDSWFNLKRDIAKVENFYFRNKLVFSEFLKRMEPKLKEWIDEYKDINDEIQFQNSFALTLKSRLDNLHHYFDSIKNDRTNKTLLTLTIISGVFLPLNLIVGFFGINTPGLIFGEDPDGTKKVILLLLATLAFCLIGLRLIRLIDHYFLRFILGKHNFYKRLSTSIRKFENRMSGK